jgi:uncharacterized protein
VKCYYLDASALVKRYVDEQGSEWIKVMMASEEEMLLFTSRMTIVEVISAFSRRVRAGTLTGEDFASVRDMFRSDCLDDYQVVPPSLAVVDQACALLERHSLRAYDAAHLATAIGVHAFLTEKEYSPITFLSADDDLNDAAEAEDLTVDNPNWH